MGGQLTSDVTTGYGPEMFVLENAQPGTYRISAMNFSDDSVRTGVRSRVDITIYEDWGRETERVAHHSVAFHEVRARSDIARVTRSIRAHKPAK